MNVRPQTSVTFEPLKAESDITSGTHRTVWTAPVLKNSGSEMFAKLTALKKYIFGCLYRNLMKFSIQEDQYLAF